MSESEIVKVNRAEAVLELYDTKFVLSCEDTEKGDWVMEITYPDFPMFAPKIYEVEDFYPVDEMEIEERMWDEVLWFLKKYHRGSDITFSEVEMEVEDED